VAVGSAVRKAVGLVVEVGVSDGCADADAALEPPLADGETVTVPWHAASSAKEVTSEVNERHRYERPPPV
jgi:hypothetical protein